MDLNYVLIWFVGISTVSWVVRWVMAHRLRFSGWLVVCLVVLAVLGIGLAADPDRAGFLSFAVWLPLLLAPALLMRVAGRLVFRQRYGPASLVSRLAALLHPADGFRQQPRLLTALDLLQRGRNAEAKQILDGLSDSDTSLGRFARLSWLASEQQWAELVEWVEGNPGVQRDRQVIGLYLRALGELGRIGAMLQAYRERLARPSVDTGAARPVAQMFVAALAGEVTTVEKLLGGPLAPYAQSIKTFWLATAHQAAGNDEKAEAMLKPLGASGDARIRSAVEHRLAHPIEVERDALGEAHRATLAEIDRELAEVAAVGTIARPARGTARATIVLLIIEALVFIIEIPGGTTDPENLLRLGALIGPLEFLQGEYWRVVTAGFLHYGALHLALNLFGIYFFGRYLERAIGSFRFVLCYIGSGVGALTLILAWTAVWGSDPFILVGASASLMGLVGATAAILLARWRRTRSRLVRRQLAFVAFIVGMQTVFDLVTPEVSFSAHFGGAVIGFSMGLVFAKLRVKSKGGS